MRRLDRSFAEVFAEGSGLGFNPARRAPRGDRSPRPDLRRRPSEIFREQCFVSMDAEERDGLETLVERGLLGSVLWGSDDPHYDAKYPGAYAAAEETFAAVGRGARDRIVAENPRRFFALRA